MIQPEHDNWRQWQPLHCMHWRAWKLQMCVKAFKYFSRKLWRWIWIFSHVQCTSNTESNPKLTYSFHTSLKEKKIWDASQVQQPEEEGGWGRRQAAQEDQAAGERGQVRFPEEGWDAGERVSSNKIFRKSINTKKFNQFRCIFSGQASCRQGEEVWMVNWLSKSRASMNWICWFPFICETHLDTLS